MRLLPRIRTFDIMKPAVFMGRAKEDMSAFPAAAKSRAGHELFMVQLGRDPEHWKPMRSVGPGVGEIRVTLPDGAFRVIYLAVFASAV
jgi:phage-related protein